MKTFSNRFLAAASFLWGVSVFLWPNPSNVRLQREAEYRPVSVGEGLYKSELTKASSGLLGARFFESFEGRPSWNIRSEFAELHRQKDSYAFMKQVTADFFSGPKGNTIKTLSDYGRSHFDKRLVELEGNVVVRSQQGYRFTMDRLDYYGKTRRFRSNDWVQMAGPNIEKPEMFVTGTGFDGYLDSENFVFRKNTRARRRLSTQEWIRVQSASSEFQPSANRAVFHQNVKTLLPDLRIESDQLEMNIGDAGG
jgi:LPS export ABC transporter protein LptC